MTKQPRINIIVAVAPDGGIGRKGELLYHVSADMRHFKTVTMGHPIIMGRKTFESFPGGALPGRRNIVITRNRDYVADGAECVGSLDEAIALCQGCDDIFIIGGAQIYNQAADIADRLYLTRFDRVAEDADAFYPAISDRQWKAVERSEAMTDPKTGVGFRFETLDRIDRPADR